MFSRWGKKCAAQYSTSGRLNILTCVLAVNHFQWETWCLHLETILKEESFVTWCYNNHLKLSISKHMSWCWTTANKYLSQNMSFMYVFTCLDKTDWKLKNDSDKTWVSTTHFHLQFKRRRFVSSIQCLSNCEMMFIMMSNSFFGVKCHQEFLFCEVTATLTRDHQM